jgi:hypothetical protein
MKEDCDGIPVRKSKPRLRCASFEPVFSIRSSNRAARAPVSAMSTCG